LKDVGGVIATAFSAAFAIAAANIVALAQICGALRATGKNGRTAADNAEHGLKNGPLALRARCVLRRLLACVVPSLQIERRRRGGHFGGAAALIFAPRPAGLQNRW
jgi:hypothetical protein